jgi:hypothetical protein
VPLDLAAMECQPSCRVLQDVAAAAGGMVQVPQPASLICKRRFRSYMQTSEYLP